MHKLLLAALLALGAHAAAAAEPIVGQVLSKNPLDGAVICYAPDKNHYVAWFDIDSALPVGTVRPIVLCYSGPGNVGRPVFSFVTVPGQSTQAAWSPDSARCAVADQPDNGSFVVWLVYKDDRDAWRSRELDPLSPVYIAHQIDNKGDDTPLFRPALRSMKWTSPSSLTFAITSDHKLYEVTLDIDSEKPLPQVIVKPEKATSAEPPENLTPFLTRCLADFEKVKAGMTRSEIEKLLPAAGGLSTTSWGRYTHPQCPLLTVEVTFDVKPDATNGEPDDKATAVSKPTLGHFVAD